MKQIYHRAEFVLVWLGYGVSDAAASSNHHEAQWLSEKIRSELYQNGTTKKAKCWLCRRLELDPLTLRTLREVLLL